MLGLIDAVNVVLCADDLNLYQFFHSSWVSRQLFTHQEGAAGGETSTKRLNVARRDPLETSIWRQCPIYYSLLIAVLILTERLWYRTVTLSSYLALNAPNETVFPIAQFWIRLKRYHLKVKNGKNVNLIVVIDLNAVGGNQV